MKLIVTFHTTTDAMAFEKLCKEEQVEGRLIPVPRSITAGCGMSWCCGLEKREEIERVIEISGMQEEAIHECMV